MNRIYALINALLLRQSSFDISGTQCKVLLFILFWNFPYISEGQGVGVNQTSPSSMLDVNGGVTIGSSYSGNYASPVNGVIIEGAVGVGTYSPVGVLHAVNNLDQEAFYFLNANVTTGPKDVFTIEDQDNSGGGQDESSVLKVWKSGTINALTDGFSLLELVNSGTVDPGDNKYWITGRVVDEGAVLWGIDITDNDIWSEGGITLGVTGADGGTYSSGTFHVDESDGSTGIGTINPISMLDIKGGVTVGNTYSGTNAAPVNGMIVEGNVGIGITSPVVELDVGGAIHIGNTTNTTNGNIRYTGSDLEGRVSNTWKSLTSGSGRGSWTNVSGSQVGVGTLTLVNITSGSGKVYGLRWKKTCLATNNLVTVAIIVDGTVAVSGQANVTNTWVYTTPLSPLTSSFSFAGNANEGETMELEFNNSLAITATNTNSCITVTVEASYALD